MQTNKGDIDSFGSLTDVIAILRYEDREDLATLLADAYVDFEYIDTGFSMTSDAEFEMVNAAIYASISGCNALRDLPQDDDNAILNALQEAWPISQAGRHDGTERLIQYRQKFAERRSHALIRESHGLAAC